LPVQLTAREKTFMGEKSCGTFISHFLSIFRYETFFRTLKITKVFRKSGSDKSIGDFKITYDMLVVAVTAVEWCVVMIDVEFCEWLGMGLVGAWVCVCVGGGLWGVKLDGPIYVREYLASLGIGSPPPLWVYFD